MGRHRAQRAPRWHRLLAAAVAVELLVGGVALSVDRLRADRPSAPPAAQRSSVVRDDGQREQRERTAEVTALLERRATAVLRRDRAAFAATVDATQPAFVRRQLASFDAMASVPFGAWRYVLDAEREVAPNPSYTGHYGGAEVWIPAVTLRFTLRDFDPDPTVAQQVFTFVRRDTGWIIGNDADFADIEGQQTARDLWDFGGVEVVRGRSTLVLGHPANRTLMRRIASEGDAAVPRVTKVWGPGWTRKVVVLVPDTQQELATMIGERGDLSQIAAVAVAELGGEGEPHPVGNRIIVNPRNFSRLGALGRQVVLTHEVTHVATRAETGPMVPTWLVEGFADYVGYLDSGVPVRSAARELRVDVRAGRVPSALPTNDDFVGTNPRLAQVYEMAWLAVRLIVERTSPSALVRFYRDLGAVTSGTPDAALRAQLKAALNTTPESFTEAWRSYLRAQLG